MSKKQTLASWRFIAFTPAASAFLAAFSFSSFLFSFLLRTRRGMAKLLSILKLKKI